MGYPSFYSPGRRASSYGRRQGNPLLAAVALGVVEPMKIRDRYIIKK
jgi:hypothetical protein